MMYCRHYEEAPCPKCFEERQEQEQKDRAKRQPKERSDREQQLCDQLAAAEARIEELRRDHRDMEQWGKEQLEYASKLSTENARLREELEYYANPHNWCAMGEGAYSDIGKRARAALEGK